jgi:hypothetical protein
LEIAFDSKHLRTICESEAHAKDELGVTVAEMLKHRLADLRAAISIRDLVAGRPRLLEGTGDLCMTLDLSEGYRMVFCANHPKNPVATTGGLDWLRVSRVKIMRIERDDV